MSRYATFTRIVHSQHTLTSAYARTSSEGGGSILLEDGAFVVSSAGFSASDLAVELVLGDGARLEVRDGLTPNVQLTLPDEYVESLDLAPGASDRPRCLYWSSPTPLRSLNDPTQNPYGYADVTLYVPESLEPLYRERWFSGRGSPSRSYLEIWEGYESPAPGGASFSISEGAGGAVESPDHYTWIGQSLAALGLSDAANVESWDVLDAAFPSDPLLWNCGKYLLRQGRKGGEERRLEDLRKARQYLDRQIARLAGEEVSDLDH